jgi:cation diffusion facilitator family transporter
MAPSRLSALMLLSIAAALVTLVLKFVAYRLTGSVGLLSDALETVVNLVAALVAWVSLRYAARPVDLDHTYGHEKIEYFSSGLEGGLIVVAAGGIVWAAVERLLRPQPLEPLGPGMALLLLAALVNGVVAVVLLRAARRHHSIALEADGKHLLTDVWTSAAVLAGLVLVWATGVEALDPVLGLLVAANILWTAWDLVRRSFDGLMDRALPEEEQARVRQAIAEQLGPHATFHALRTRRAGRRRFVDFHLLVPGQSTVRQAHDLTGRVEEAVRAVVPGVEVQVHIEPIEEAASYQDSALLPLEAAQKPARINDERRMTNDE